jgi:hypothetical protein
LPAAYAAAYGRGYPGYASFGLPYPAGKLEVNYSLTFLPLSLNIIAIFYIGKKMKIRTRDPVVVSVAPISHIFVSFFFIEGRFSFL